MDIKYIHQGINGNRKIITPENKEIHSQNGGKKLGEMYYEVKIGKTAM